MSRLYWFLARLGAGLNLCLLTGCIFTSAEKPDPLVVRDPVLVPRDTVMPTYPNKEVVARELEVEASEPPPPPPEPITERVPQKLIEPPPVTPAPPTPPAQPPQPPADPPAIAALRDYLDNKPDSASAVLQQLLPVVASASMAELDGGPNSAALVKERLDLLTETLRPRPALTLSKVCFTRNIESFGRYDPLLADCPAFQSGIDGRPGDRVQLYVEVRNFVSRKVGSYWETALSSTLEFRKLDDIAEMANRQPGVQLRRPARPDRSLSPRQDYSLGIEFHVPPGLPPGLYELKIRVCDELASIRGATPVDPRAGRAE